MPIAFFEEGAKDREQKIADLRSQHDRRTSIEPIQLPRVDWKGFSDDPIGAGLDALQSTLQGVINRDAQKKAEQRREALAVAESIYSAHQESGIEKTEAEVAEEFYQQTGVSIYSVTRQHARIVGQGNGRIQGRKAVSEFNKKVDAGEWTDPASFDKAWEESMAEYDKGTTNRAVKQGYLEVLGANRLALQEKVFALGVAKREQEGLDTVGSEVQAAFQDAVVSDNPEEAWKTVGTIITTSFGDLRKANPKITDQQIAATLSAAVQAEIEAGKEIDKVDELVDTILGSGVITSQQARADLLARKRTALDAYENSVLDPPIEKKMEIMSLVPEMQFDFLQHGKFSDKMLKRWDKVSGGSAWAIEELAKLTRNLETRAKAQKEGGTPIPESNLAAYYVAMANGDTAGMRAALPENVIRDAVDDPKGVTQVNSMLSTIREYDRGQLTPAADAERDFALWLKEPGVGLGLDPLDAVPYMQGLQAKLAAEKNLTPTRANQIMNEFRKSIVEQKKRDASTPEKEAQRIITEVGVDAATSYEAGVVLLDFESKIIAAEKDAAEKARIVAEHHRIAAENTRTTTGPRQRPVTNVVESDRRATNRSTAERQLKEAERKLIELEAERLKWDEVRADRLRLEKATRGMKPEQKVSYNIWTGNHDGSDRILYYT